MIDRLDRIAQAYGFWVYYNAFFCGFDVVAAVVYFFRIPQDPWCILWAPLFVGLAYLMLRNVRRNRLMLRERDRERREAEKRADTAHYAMGEWF